MPTKQSTPKKRRAASLRTSDPRTQEERDFDVLYPRFLKRLNRQLRPLLPEPSEKELKEILAHFSLLDVWRGIREVRESTKPKFSTQHRPWLTTDINRRIVWRYSIPLIEKYTGEVSTGIDLKLPEQKNTINAWITNLPPFEKACILEAKFRAKAQQKQAIERAYLLWSAIFAALVSFGLIRDSVGFACGSVVDETTRKAEDEAQGEKQIIAAAQDFQKRIFKTLGIDVDIVNSIAQFASDFQESNSERWIEFPEHYS